MVWKDLNFSKGHWNPISLGLIRSFELGVSEVLRNLKALKTRAVNTVSSLTHFFLIDFYWKVSWLQFPFGSRREGVRGSCLNFREHFLGKYWLLSRSQEKFILLVREENLSVLFSNLYLANLIMLSLFCLLFSTTLWFSPCTLVIWNTAKVLNDMGCLA